MITNETKRKLREMRLTAMVEALEVQQINSDYQKLSFDDRFQLIVDGAYANQQSNRITRLIRQANFSTNEPCISDINYREDRKLDQNLILTLAAGNYIKEGHNIIIKGASGCGKTWLATALGIEACQQFYKVKYLRLPELLDDLAVAKHEANGSFRTIIERYKKVNLLIVDEWMLTPITDEQAQIILELIEYRTKRTATIFCTQFNPDGWYNKFNNPQVAEAILDRIIHNSYQIYIHGEVSMRELYGLQ